MSVPLRGRVRGASIELDVPVPQQLEGKRVLVLLQPDDEPAGLSAEEQRAAWEEWVHRGPQGPIEDEQDAAFP